MKSVLNDDIFQSYMDGLVAIIGTIMDTGEFFNSEEYRAKVDGSRLYFSRVLERADGFMNVVKGEDIRQARIPGLDPEKWNLPAKFFGLTSPGGPGEGRREIIEKALDRCFYYGLLYHLLAWRSPDPAAMEMIDLDRAFMEWAPLSFDAYGELRNYDDRSNYVPSRVFTYFHEHEVKPAYREWKYGFFKRIKAETFFQRLFFSGCLLSVKAVEQMAEK